MRVAVLPMVVHSMESSEYLRDGLVDMLISRLGGQPHLAVVRVEDPAQATNDLAQALESGRSVGARYVIFGSFTQFGLGASLDLSCAAVTSDESDEGTVRKLFVQSGKLGEIIPRLDELAEKIGVHIAQGGRVAPPAVAGAPPGLAPQTGAPLEIPAVILDGLSEIENLRERLDALESAVYSTESHAEDATLPGNGEAFASQPDGAEGP